MYHTIHWNELLPEYSAALCIQRQLQATHPVNNAAIYWFLVFSSSGELYCVVNNIAYRPV